MDTGTVSLLPSGLAGGRPGSASVTGVSGQSMTSMKLRQLSAVSPLGAVQGRALVRSKIAML